MSDKTSMPTDEELTSFIDGEMRGEAQARIARLIETEAGVAERFEYLSRANLPFREAFAPLLEAAPVEKLQQALAATYAQAAGSKIYRPNRRNLLSAIAASVCAGIVLDRGWLAWGNLPNTEEGAEWRGAVATYMALYTADTLAGVTPDRQSQLAQLSVINSRLGLALTPEAIALPNAEFRHALILNYDDRPLAQIAYLDDHNRPLALCILKKPSSATPPAVERRNGMNIVYWSGKNGTSLLIGHLSASDLEKSAAGVSERIRA